MSDKYILGTSGNPVPEENLLVWAQWFENNPARRIVKKTRIGDSEVSTVFLGLDHSFGHESGPLIYETLVFGGSLANEMERCSTPAEALEGHIKMCERVRAESAQEDKP